MLATSFVTAKHIDDIASCLLSPANRLQGFGYAQGLLGKVLFFLYYGAYTQEEKYTDLAGILLQKAVANTTKDYQGHNYYKDLAELGIFLEYMLANELIDSDTNQLLSTIDSTQAKWMAESLAAENLDPYNGALVGGLYFLSRSRSTDEAYEHLKNLTESIMKLSVEEGGGLYWYSTLKGSKEVYLGISHGLAAILIFVCRMYELKVFPEACRKTIKGAIYYLLLQRRDDDKKGYYFPDIVGKDAGKTKLSLCYGDLGVGYSLLRAAEVLKDESIKQTAIQILIHSARRRSPEDSLVKDSSILYGASGVALMFDKVYALTNNFTFSEAANYWYEKVPTYATHEDSPAGYKSRYNQNFHHTNISFKEGIAGIGCTLIKYTERNNYSFDELIWLL